MDKRVLVVYNPASGPNVVRRQVEQAVAVMRHEGWRPELHETEGPGDAQRIAQIAVRDNVGVIAVAGGDGTINEVLQSIQGTRTSLYVLPCGTGNGWARWVGMPLSSSRQPNSLLQAVKHLHYCRSSKVDVGLLGERYFLLNVSIGIDGSVVQRVAKRRLHHRHTGSLYYSVFGLASMFRFRGFSVQLDMDMRTIFKQALLVLVLNVGLYAAQLLTSQSVHHDDGILDIFVVEGRRGLQALLPLLRMIGQHGLAGPGVVHYRTRKLRIQCFEAVMGNIDGEPLSIQSAEISVVPNGLSAMIPIRPTNEVAKGPKERRRGD